MPDINAMNIINRLCTEFQSVWIVDLETMDMSMYKVDEETASIIGMDAFKKLKTYIEMRSWYISNCITVSDQKRVAELSSVDYIVEKISNGKPYCIEYNRINGDKINYNQIYYAKYEPDEEEIKHFILGFRNIDMIRKAEYDDLTGVYTRLAFFQKAEQLLLNNPDTQYDIMLSDIVDFKSINDTYGVDIGDEILRFGGSFLLQRYSDDILVGRYGGDQFVILASHEYMQEIVKINENFDAPNQLKKANLPTAVVKYGVFEDISQEKSIISACDKAHLALNSIKHQYDKLIAYYDDNLRNAQLIANRIENSMREALNTDQFKVYYQPKHNAATGELIGAEALIRWIHPEYGFMSPGEFIPLFEKNGFIVESDYYVWKRTCENLSRWKSSGIKVVPVSVNASKLTFAQTNMLDYLSDITTSNNIPSDLLHVEITETLMTDDVDILIDKLNSIKKQGFQIELDDFGSGYSSINLLSALPLDVVKLDMSFMRQFGDMKRSKVLAACIKLANELGYKTISEGVELKEQRDLLSILGVDAIQGYYFSKPLPEEEFEKYMRDYGL